mmetsp:Transcript_28446/g.35145  ORF Transcript_28446/g.35145 Transcript_28446/m.35145 type:complete len:82 (+) Transcript_28446:505-750(+)
METGQGVKQLREYQLKLSDYRDLDLLADFLAKTRLSTAHILSILRQEKVGSFGAIEKFINAAAQASESAEPSNRIILHNME